MKYIIFEDTIVGTFPIIFPNTIAHDKMNKTITKEYPAARAINAGFITKEGTCHGESMSLNLNSGPYDEKIINIYYR